jgi:hypothetical protein
VAYGVDVGAEPSREPIDNGGDVFKDEAIVDMWKELAKCNDFVADVTANVDDKDSLRVVGPARELLDDGIDLEPVVLPFAPTVHYSVEGCLLFGALTQPCKVVVRCVPSILEGAVVCVLGVPVVGCFEELVKLCGNKQVSVAVELSKAKSKDKTRKSWPYRKTRFSAILVHFLRAKASGAAL